MSKESTQNTPDVSGETINDGYVDDARSAVELQRESDAKYVECYDETMTAVSTDSESDDDDEEGGIQDTSSDSDADAKEGVQDVCEKAEVLCLNQFHLLAERGDTEAVRSLLMSSANVDVLDTKQNTPLHIATRNGHVDAVNLLLNNNAGVDSRNALGQTSLHLAAEIGHLIIAQILLKSNADVHITDQFMKTPIHIAATYGHYELVHLLMKYSDDPLILSGSTPLHLAAKFCHKNVVHHLLNHNQNADATNLDGDTPLHLASEYGHFDVAEVLLRNNADANIRNASSKTPLHIAAKMDHAEIVKTLIDHEGEVNAVERNGNTALHYASQNGHFEVAEVLLRNNADANIRNASGKTPLHIAAKMGHAEIVKTLIDHHGKINAVDRNGDTALNLAASNGHSIAVNVLLNQCTEKGSQLVVSQVPADECELSQHPVKNKIDVGQTSLLVTAEGGNVEMAATLLSQSSTVNAVFIEAQATPLHLAIEHGHAEIVENLIYKGANVKACNNSKMTALHLACKNGHTSIVEILLDNHATADVMKQSAETPFYLAAKNGHADISDLLLRRGVWDFVLTDDRQTPLHVAVEEGHTKVVEVILKHSRRISGKVRKDGHKLQENAKQVQLLKCDGRSVSAEVVWVEKSEPLEIWRNSDGNTALDIAVISTQPKMVKLLLNADHCAYSKDHLRRCFSWLTETKFNSKGTARGRSYDEKKQMYCENIKEIAQALINSGKFNVNQPNFDGETPLYEVMNLYADLLLVGLPEKIHKNYLIQLLLENGADYNIKNYNSENISRPIRYGETPLITACYNCGYYHIIQLFFDWEQKSGMKLDVDARDRYGATALIRAAENNNVSTVQLLINHGASVNLYDYFGFTALHAAIYEPNKTWFDLNFFCEGPRKRKFDSINSLQISSKDKITWRKETMDPHEVNDRIKKYLRKIKRTTRFKEEVVKLLLANVETDVNATDLDGNTPLDLAVKISKGINSATLKALKNRGAFRKQPEPEDEAPIEVARIDERGRNPLHRLIISRTSDYVTEYETDHEEAQERERLDCMVYGILLRPENFRESATAADYKGRTPLHYAVMPSFYLDDPNYELVRVLLKLGSNLSAADMYGKTPLHYAEMYDQYELLVQYGADENIKDRHACTPRELRQLRESVTINKDNAKEVLSANKVLSAPIDITQLLFNNFMRVTELSKHKLVETIRIFSQSPRPQESAEEAIWKTWTENEFTRLNRHLGQLKPLIQHFIERLADGIKEKDWRFECHPILVGSADEETKAVISADFDFNFKLIKFSQLCDPFPHPLGPKGYFQLRQKSTQDRKGRSDDTFDSFFNVERCLLTNEVNSRFKIILGKVLSDPSFWQDEHLFDWNVRDDYTSKDESLHGLCKTIRLRMIYPIEDGEGGFVFVNIAIDIVACVQVEGWWPEDPLAVGINPAVKTDGCTFVFDRPRFNPSDPRAMFCVFSETFARISFAPLESRIIKESPPLIKAAYIVCKIILYPGSWTTYQLKNCSLFYMEALNARIGNETRKEEKITPKQLSFWVERIMFCFMEFSRHGVFPCYFMPSFRQRVVEMLDGELYFQGRKNDMVNGYAEDLTPLFYCKAYDFYLDLCPDDTTIDIGLPIVGFQREYCIKDRSLDPSNGDPMWEEFEREEFIKTISSRNSN